MNRASMHENHKAPVITAAEEVVQRLFRATLAGGHGYLCVPSVDRRAQDLRETAGVPINVFPGMT
jgi:hypothetical protein